MGRHLARVGAEFGSTTGRPRRCGWFDAVAARRAVLHNGVTGLCVTKLDVLDGLDRLKICVGYRLGGQVVSIICRCWWISTQTASPFTRNCRAGGRPPSGSQTAEPARGGTDVSRPYRGDPRRAGRHDLHRRGPESEYRHPPSVRLAMLPSMRLEADPPQPMRQPPWSRCLRSAAARFFCLVSVAGCTAGFVYNRLDWLVSWYVNGLVSLDDAQEEQLRTSVRRTLAWHRETQLTRYIGFSARPVQPQMQGPVTAEGTGAALPGDGESP